MAYGAQGGQQWFVVVDTQEGQPYDDLITRGGGRIVFDSRHALHYLAVKGTEIYSVKESISQSKNR